VLAIAAGVWLDHAGLIRIRDFAQLFYGTPHGRYAASLKRSGLADTPAGRAWLESAEASIAEASRVRLPHHEQVSFSSEHGSAVAVSVALRRGQRYIAETAIEDGDPSAVFVDLFEREGSALRHVASAAPDERAVAIEIPSDAEYVLRLQPELERDVRVTLALHTEPTLRLPVERATRSSIQSFFGDSRDRGHRDHQGVDIFAKRGTPVVAATDGIVWKVGTNGLGGNVVWVARPFRGERHYYAHLDRQLVTPGTFVKAGDVIGTVGNTGNARTTAPHLHFGIYAPGGAVDPLPYISEPRKPRVVATHATARPSTGGAVGSP
jgi:murein DD-endopeptidase MepM/ murein hydrolase activator NlpD